MLSPNLLRLRALLCVALSASFLNGCATSGDERVQHGMAPSSTGPKPNWYVKQFGLPRGVGEALRRDTLSLWDQDSGTFTYTIRGEMSAQFHPWEHFLKIKPEGNNKTFADECKWSKEGMLNNSQPDKINPKIAEQCNKLIHELAQELHIQDQ